jgi:hypothetical protein
LACLADLVLAGLASVVPERMRAGSKMIEVAKVRITAAGREAHLEATNKSRISLPYQRGGEQRDSPMWLDLQPWLPLLTISLTITLCFGIVSMMKGLSHSK